MAGKGNKKFIQDAIKKPGSLHAELGVPQGKPIPKGKLKAAAKKGGKEGARARFALNVLIPASKKKKRKKKSKSKK
jgi:hypothetical protein